VIQNIIDPVFDDVQDAPNIIKPHQTFSHISIVSTYQHAVQALIQQTSLVNKTSLDFASSNVIRFLLHVATFSKITQHV